MLFHVNDWKTCSFWPDSRDVTNQLDKFNIWSSSVEEKKRASFCIIISFFKNKDTSNRYHAEIKTRFFSQYSCYGWNTIRIWYGSVPETGSLQMWRKVFSWNGSRKQATRTHTHTYAPRWKHTAAQPWARVPYCSMELFVKRAHNKGQTPNWKTFCCE